MRRRILSLFLSIVFVVMLMTDLEVVQAAQTYKGWQRGQLVGKWTGYYYAGQGKTALILQVKSVSGAGKVEAVFNFSEHPDNPGVPTGSYTMSGTFDFSNNKLSLDGTSWTQQPSGYFFVNIRGNVSFTSGVISGTTSNYSGLYLTKNIVPYDDDAQYDDYAGQGQKPLTESKSSANNRILASSKEEIKGASYPLLQAWAVKVKATSFTIKWNRIPGATKYLIYGNKCGRKNKYEYIKATTKRSYKAKKVQKNRFYKYLVVAVKGDRVISISKTVHVGTKTKQNPTKVSVGKKSIILTNSGAGSTYKVKYKILGTKLKQHRGIRCETDNVNVATVTNKGKIKAVGAGSCNVYIYAQNGVSAKIKVKVLQ